MDDKRLKGMEFEAAHSDHRGLAEAVAELRKYYDATTTNVTRFAAVAADLAEVRTVRADAERRLGDAEARAAAADAALRAVVAAKESLDARFEEVFQELKARSDVDIKDRSIRPIAHVHARARDFENVIEKLGTHAWWTNDAHRSHGADSRDEFLDRTIDVLERLLTNVREMHSNRGPARADD